MKLTTLLPLFSTTALFFAAPALDAQCGGCDKKEKKQSASCGESAKSCQDSAKECTKTPRFAKRLAGGTVDSGTLLALLGSKTPFTLVDARNQPKERIHGARHLNAKAYGCAETLAAEVGPKNRLVVTYCSGPACSASTQSAALLRKAGYTNVVEYKEGWAGWQRLAALCPTQQPKASEPACGDSSKCATTCDECAAKVKARKLAQTPQGTVDTAALQAILAAGAPATIIDARTGAGDDGQRLPGALTLDCSGCNKATGALDKNHKDRLVVTYCSGPACSAGSQLAAKLRRDGYRNVVVYREGLAGWNKAGLKAVKAAPCCQEKAEPAAGSCCGTCGDKK